MKHGILNRFIDRFMGRGSAAVTVPALDGALKPNNLLEDLPKGLDVSAPNDITIWQSKALWTDGAQLVSDAGILVDLGSNITALAADESHIVAATLADGLIVLNSAMEKVTPVWSVPQQNITALDIAPDGQLWFCVGSAQNAPTEWRSDLMEKNASGMVGHADLSTGETKIILRRLSYPSGIAATARGSIVFSEAWASHLVEIAPEGGTKHIILDEIPGYPGRLHSRAEGGYWLSIFAPRSPLIEFVLREPGYLRAMLREVPSDYWVAPSYASGRSFHEPMQGGSLKQMGILKPWAPTLSYGLVVELDAQFNPLRSFHSRAGGKRHGITAVCELQDELRLVGCGSNEILHMPLANTGASA